MPKTVTNVVVEETTIVETKGNLSRSKKTPITNFIQVDRRDAKLSMAHM
mgnify:CR=1 FL=1